jgi:hypothetical protein
MEMSLHDNITLELANGLGNGTMKFVEVDIEWDDFGVQCLASCNISFQLDDATVTDGCCDGDIIPPISICTEKFCDPDLDLIEAVITDFSYTDAGAIADGLSTEGAPTIGAGCTWDGNKLCTSTPLADNVTFIEFEKNVLNEEKYYFRFTIDSISGQVDIYRDGVLGASYTAVGTYELWVTPSTAPDDITIEFKTVGTTEICMTLETFAIWVPCLTTVNEFVGGIYGWTGYDEGLLFSGNGGGLYNDGRLTTTVPLSSNYTYAVEIDYEIPVEFDCVNIWVVVGNDSTEPPIDGQIIATITNNPEPESGTYSFNFDPRDYSIGQDEDLKILIIPCDPETSVIGLSGIRFCGLLY